MDLLIEKDGQSLRLSSLGFYNISVSDSSPRVDVLNRSVRGRSGYIHDGVRFAKKVITVKARLASESLSSYMEKMDELNGLFYGNEPFYITKMLPDDSELYGFELPGVKTGDISTITGNFTKWKYRFKVIMLENIKADFIGKSEQGLKYDLVFSFDTAELPYGETIPKPLTVTGNSIPYCGTAKLSQLEWPFVVELTANASQTSFYVEIDGRRFTYKYATVPIASGEKLLITGVETTLGQKNVTNRTNYEYFEIKPKPSKSIPFRTDFKGTVKILNFVELYQ